MTGNLSDLLSVGRDVLTTEAAALVRAAALLGASFEHSVQAVLTMRGKVVASGLGKSGYVARKVAVTFASTGVPSIYMHPVEAMHGDIGNLCRDDVVLVFTASGQTTEVVQFVHRCRERGATIVAVVGDCGSPVGRLADCVIDASVQREASPIGMIPTASTTVALGLGDALAMAVMQARGFTLDDLALNHPSGAIGLSLTTHVSDLMHPLDECAVVEGDVNVGETILRMTRYPLGAALVLEGERLAGLLTEGDLRRALQRDSPQLLNCTVSEFMTKAPRTVEPSLAALQALRLMEESHPIYVMPVVDSMGRCAGLLRMHDIVRAGLHTPAGPSGGLSRES